MNRLTLTPKLLLAAWMAIGLCVIVSRTASAAETPPNILFIFADDQCYETIHALGNQQIETPNLDRLVRSGVTFTHTHNMGAWHGAVCVASRTMLNTGRFLWRARGMEKQLKQEAAAGKFWAQYLKQAGYETYMTGKWHVKADAAKVFDHTVHIRPGMPKDTKAGYNRPIEGQPDPWSPSDPKFGGFWEGGVHWSEVLANDATTYLAQAAQSEKPFFMYLAFNASHDPRQSPQEYVDKYPWQQMELPVNYLPDYPFKEEMGAGKGLRDEKLAPWPRTEYAVKVHRREYYALITHMDVQIGKILEALERSGKADNTYIFFTADHGLAVGHHGLMGKQNMFEHSLRPPMIVAGPGIPRNKQISARVYLQDIMPTTLELAHVEIPEQVEFRSLLPLIQGQRTQQYEAIYGAYRDNMQRAVIQDNWKLIYYPQADKTLMFNLTDDPQEMTNLADDPQWATKRKKLSAALQKLEQEMDDPLLK